jgi:hypothetical protein
MRPLAVVLITLLGCARSAPSKSPVDPCTIATVLYPSCMKFIPLPIIMAFPFVAGCLGNVDSLCHHRSFNVIIDQGIPAWQVNAALDAVGQWSACGIGLSTNVGHCDGSDPGAGNICVRQLPLDAIHAEAFPDTLDYTTVVFPDGGPSGASIDINPQAGAGQIAHEIGHGMGMSHTGPGTVMCKDTGCGADHVTEIDCANWAASRE